MSSVCHKLLSIFDFFDETYNHEEMLIRRRSPTVVKKKNIQRLSRSPVKNGNQKSI